MKLNGQPKRPETGAAPDAASGMRSVVKSSAIIGGASAMGLLIGLVRAKLIALLVGTAGVGLLGVLSSIMAGAAAFCGVAGQSGVRLLASSPPEERAAMARAVRRVSWQLGGCGAVIVVLAALPLAQVTFGDSSFAVDVGLLGAAVLLATVTVGWNALLQAERRIVDLAWSNVMGALAGVLVAVPLLWWLGIRSIALVLVLGAAAAAVVAYGLVRRAGNLGAGKGPVAPVGPLLRLGLCLAAGGVFAQLSAYAVRAFVTRGLGLESAGQYQAAFSIAGSLPGFVLVAMGTDFFPRIAEAKSAEDANLMVNQQVTTALLLALPGLLVLVGFAPQCVHLLYTAGFDEAIPLLRLLCLGVLGRVVSWPLGYTIMARASGATVVVTEALAAAMQIGLSWVLLKAWGLLGAGIAFGVAYAGYLVVVWAVMWRLTGFRPARRVVLYTLLSVGALLGLAVATWNLSGWHGLGVALAASGAGAWFCLRQLEHLTGRNTLTWVSGRLRR